MIIKKKSSIYNFFFSATRSWLEWFLPKTENAYLVSYSRFKTPKTPFTVGKKKNKITFSPVIWFFLAQFFYRGKYIPQGPFFLIFRFSDTLIVFWPIFCQNFHEFRFGWGRKKRFSALKNTKIHRLAQKLYYLARNTPLKNRTKTRFFRAKLRFCRFFKYGWNDLSESLRCVFSHMPKIVFRL